jgi:hypothetical protein
MQVSINEIKQVFDDLIEEKKSREEIAFWASIRRNAHDKDDLEFELLIEKK